MRVPTTVMSQEKQDLLRSWQRESVPLAEAVQVMLLADLTNQEPDFIRQRMGHLRRQCKSIYYDTPYQP